MKLELKHVAPYFPYGLIVKHNDEDTLLTDLHVSGVINPVKYEAGITSVIDVDEVKPILRPISSITEEEALELLGCAIAETKEYPYKGSFNIIKEENGFVAKSKCCSSEYSLFVDNGTLCIEESFSDCNFNCHYPNIDGYEWLFKSHFDIYGLIEKGLAIDKTELK